MFGGSVMEPFVTLNGALVAFWVALAVGLELGFHGIWLAAFIVAVEVLWFDFSSSLRRKGRSPR